MILNKDRQIQETKGQSKPKPTTQTEQMAIIPIHKNSHPTKMQTQLINKIMVKDRHLQMEHKLQRMDKWERGNLKC